MNKSHGPRELAKDILGRSLCLVQMGAVISDNKGRIISWGWNHPYDKGSYETATIHAEEHAIMRANQGRLLRGKITITVAGKWGKNGNIACAKPCTGRCMPLAKKYGIDIIEYQEKDGTWTRIKLGYS